PGVRYGEREKHILQFVSTQIAMAIERKRTEEQLLENERRYRLLFQANPEAMWVYDCETLRFLAVNAAAVARYGYSEQEFLAMTVRDIRPASELPRFEETLRGQDGGTSKRSRTPGSGPRSSRASCSRSAAARCSPLRSWTSTPSWPTWTRCCGGCWARTSRS